MIASASKFNSELAFALAMSETITAEEKASFRWGGVRARPRKGIVGAPKKGETYLKPPGCTKKWPDLSFNAATTCCSRWPAQALHCPEQAARRRWLTWHLGTRALFSATTHSCRMSRHPPVSVLQAHRQLDCQFCDALCLMTLALSLLSVQVDIECCEDCTIYVLETCAQVFMNTFGGCCSVASFWQRLFGSSVIFASFRQCLFGSVFSANALCDPDASSTAARSRRFPRARD